MAGLIVLFAIGIWLFLCGILAAKIPNFLGIRRGRIIWSLLVFLILLTAPVVDDQIGMRQFDRLCRERAIPWISPNADQVKRAKVVDSERTELPGYWIRISSKRVTYLDIDTGRPFLEFEVLFTKGGRIVGLTLMGGTQSCSPETSSQFIEQLKRLNIQLLLEQGYKS